MGKKSKCLIVRIDEHTYLQIKEIGQIQRVGLSAVARALIRKTLNDITDREGYIKPGDHGKKDSK